MRLLIAAAPLEDFAREYSPVLVGAFCLLLALLVVRLVVKTMTRLVLLGSITLLSLFVLVERDNISECTQTCDCTIAGMDTSVPFCDRARI